MGDNKEEKLAFYKLYRNKLNHILRITEIKYYQDLLSEHQSNVKKLWQEFKTIINKRKYKPVNTKFKCNDTITEDGQVISNKFNNFFGECWHINRKILPFIKEMSNRTYSHQ